MGMAGMIYKYIEYRGYVLICIRFIDFNKADLNSSEKSFK